MPSDENAEIEIQRIYLSAQAMVEEIRLYDTGRYNYAEIAESYLQTMDEKISRPKTFADSFFSPWSGGYDQVRYRDAEQLLREIEVYYERALEDYCFCNNMSFEETKAFIRTHKARIKARF